MFKQVLAILAGALSLAVSQKELLCVRKFNEYCTFIDQTIEKNDTIKLGVAGDNSSDFPDIQQIEFINSSIYFIPLEIFETFPNVDMISCENQSVQNVSTSFSNARNMKRLFFSRNHINFLEEDLFVGAQSLISLYLPENGIQDVDENAFRNLSLLTLLNLKGNHIRTLEKNTFNGLINLKLLYLHENYIEVIKSDLGSSLKLREIYLQGNRITSISLIMIHLMPDFKIFNLVKNLCIDKYFEIVFDMDRNIIERRLINCASTNLFQDNERRRQIVIHIQDDFKQKLSMIDTKLQNINVIIEEILKDIEDLMQILFTRPGGAPILETSIFISIGILVVLLLYSAISGYRTHRQIYFGRFQERCDC